MIVRSAFRGAGGFANHLTRADTNEAIQFRDDLSSWPTVDRRSLIEAIDAFSALGQVHGTKSPLLHIVISPSHPLTSADEAMVLRHICRAYQIPDGQPMFALEHDKPGETDRAVHLHFVFQRLKAAEGRLISDRSRLWRNEQLSLEIAFDLGHPLIAGPRVEQLRPILARERPEMAEALAALTAPTRSNATTTAGDRLQAANSQIDLRMFDARVFDVVVQQRTDLAKAHLAVAAGDRALMVVDSATGFSSRWVASCVAKQAPEACLDDPRSGSSLDISSRRRSAFHPPRRTSAKRRCGSTGSSSRIAPRGTSGRRGLRPTDAAADQNNY